MSGGKRRANWVAFGFVGAFAASVATVIYTGLKAVNVEVASAEFDAGFRSVTMAVGDERTIDLVFDAVAVAPEATLDLMLPQVVEVVDGGARRAVAVTRGRNEFAVTVRGTAQGSGYIVARLAAREPIDLYRVFVTVE